QLSGMFTGAGDRVRGLEVGADGYLVRPAEAAELIATIRALLRASRAERDLHASEPRRRAAEVLAAASPTITHSRGLGGVGQRLVVSLRDGLGVAAAGRFRLDEATGDMLRVAIAGEMGPAFPSREVLPRGTGLIGVALREGRPVHAPDVLADERVTFSPDLHAAIAQTPYRSAVALPPRAPH